MKFEKSLDVRGEICPYPMMITNKELDSNPKLNSLEIILDHPPALSTIPPEAMKRVRLWNWRREWWRMENLFNKKLKTNWSKGIKWQI